MDKATTERLIRHAWKYGHFRNPDLPDTHAVLEVDLDIISVTDEVARQAISSVQQSDIQVDSLCMMHHLRPLRLDDAGKPDGDAGPATIGLLDIPRCDVPDFGTAYGLENAGSGGWLDCDENKTVTSAEHSIAIRMDERRASRTWQDYLPTVKLNAERISADIGLAVRHLPFDTDEDFESSVIFKNIPGGVIGFYYLPPGNSCSTIPQGALDTSFNPDVDLASLLWIHEGLGHGIGLQHTRGGIMNPSIIRTTMSWRNDPSWLAVQRKYGGEPLAPVEPPIPPPVPGPPGETWTILDGEIKIRFGDHVNTFRLIESSGA